MPTVFTLTEELTTHPNIVFGVTELPASSIYDSIYVIPYLHLFESGDYFIS